MDLSLGTILVFATGVLAGVVAALKIIAPRTKNKVDDKVEAWAEKGLDLLQGASPAPEANKA